MQRFELAARRFIQIVPKPIIAWSDFPREKIRRWLDDDVSPVVEGFAARPTFREYARWPIWALAAGSGTAERAAIDAVDSALTSCAKIFQKVCGRPAHRKRLKAAFPPKSQVTRAEETIGGPEPGIRVLERKQIDVLAIELRQLADIATRRRGDLVKSDDYFEPTQEWTGDDEHPGRQRAEMIVSVNESLRPVGNFVVRCLFRRIEGMHSLLAGIYRKCLATFRAKSRGDSTVRRNIERAWTDLDEKVRWLRSNLQTGQTNVVRESCVILTQVYAAFHPKPDVQWLGMDEELVKTGSSLLRARLQQFRNMEMIDRIAAALEDLPKVYENGAPDLSVRDEAIAGGGLVIVKVPAAVYWEGKLVSRALKARQWDFLVALAEKGKRRMPVVEPDIYEDVQADSTMSTTCGRLRKALPPSLGTLIGRGDKNRSYRLDLEPHQIHLF